MDRGRVDMVHIGVQDSSEKWVQLLRSRWPLAGFAGRSVFGIAGVAFEIVSMPQTPEYDAFKSCWIQTIARKTSWSLRNAGRTLL